MGSDKAEKKSVRVTIFNQPYALRTAGDPDELREVARTVDTLMSEVSAKGGFTDTSRVAVLTCLHLADRLRTLERELAALKKQIGQKSQEFATLLDSALHHHDSGSR